MNLHIIFIALTVKKHKCLAPYAGTNVTVWVYNIFPQSVLNAIRSPCLCSSRSLGCHPEHVGTDWDVHVFLFLSANTVNHTRGLWFSPVIYCCYCRISRDVTNKFCLFPCWQTSIKTKTVQTCTNKSISLMQGDETIGYIFNEHRIRCIIGDLYEHTGRESMSAVWNISHQIIRVVLTANYNSQC